MKILVVEDEPVLRDGLVDLLRGAGHAVEAEGDGRAAEARAIREDFDLVVLDLMLPGRDGIEICTQLRLTRPHLPVLMLTARGAEEEKVRGLRAGADDYVTKPFGARELLARVDALGRRALAIPADPEIVEAGGCRLDLGRPYARRRRRQDRLPGHDRRLPTLDRYGQRPERVHPSFSAPLVVHRGSRRPRSGRPERARVRRAVPHAAERSLAGPGFSRYVLGAWCFRLGRSLRASRRQRPRARASQTMVAMARTPRGSTASSMSKSSVWLAARIPLASLRPPMRR